MSKAQSPLLVVVLVGGLAHLAASQPSGSPREHLAELREFVGKYAITAGAQGQIEVQPFLGGAYLQWHVTFTEVNASPHELYFLVGAPDNSGAYPVWRFESEPAPLIHHDGTARLSDSALLAEFGRDGSSNVFRERWKLLGAHGLQFELQAGPPEAVKTVGTFTAKRL